MLTLLRRSALLTLIFALSIALVRPSGAQTLTILHSFGRTPKDGEAPLASLVQDRQGNFYGVTTQGGTHHFDTVFRMTPTGKVTVLHGFGASQTDGKVPSGLVYARDGNLYGTTSAGGSTVLTDSFNYSGGLGTAYRITSTGKYTVLHNFRRQTSHDGWSPNGLIQGRDGHFYGTTEYGGAFDNIVPEYGNGTVFKMTRRGHVTTLHNFGDGRIPSDGVCPATALTQCCDGIFYGTTQFGGSSGGGTVFKITRSGKVTIVHSFKKGDFNGFEPNSQLVQDMHGNFYGTTAEGGLPPDADHGTIFKVTRIGKYSVLHRFSRNGRYPQGLVLGTDGNLYGTTYFSGSASERAGGGDGSLFKVTTTARSHSCTVLGTEVSPTMVPRLSPRPFKEKMETFTGRRMEEGLKVEERFSS